MKFRELNLIAFGHFTDTVLRLRDEPGCVHFFLGQNEAGKSTTLRAIRALLYGFPERSRDNFLHPKPLVGGCLELAGGNEFNFLRRKGRKNTVLDTDKQPIDDGTLSQALQGISESQFVHGFGLNHGSLRAGAQALLEGQGHLGESLFSAQVGGAGIHRLLQRLDEEANGLFRPRGKQYPLNQAISEFKEAQRRVRHGAVKRDAYRTQRSALEETERELDQVTATFRERSRALEDKKRHLALLPLISRYRDTERRRQDLGDVPLLPHDEQERRLRVERAIERCDEQLQDQQGAVRRLEAKLSELGPRSALLDVAEEIIEEVELRKAKVLHAEAELPGHRHARDGLRTQLAEQLTLLGRPKDTDWNTLQLPASVSSRIHSVSRELAGIGERLTHAEHRKGQLERELAELDRELAACEGPEQSVALLAAIDDADALLAGEAATDALRREQEQLQSLATRQLAALHPRILEGVSISADGMKQLNALPLPANSVVDSFEREQLASTRELEQLQNQLSENESFLADLQSRRRRLEQEGEVPSLERLQALRAERERLWVSIRRTLEDKVASDREPQRSLGLEGSDWRAFEKAVEEADGAADQLRQDASRVALAAELSQSQQEATKAQDALLKKERIARERHEAGLKAWDDLWTPTQVSPLSPTEMRGWLRRVEALQETADKLIATEFDLANRAQKYRDVVQQLDQALTASTGDAKHDLGTLRQLAAQRQATWENVHKKREALQAEHTSLRKQLPAVEESVSQERYRQAEAQRRWAEVVLPLGLTDDARPEEATAVLDRTGELSRKGKQLRDVEEQIKKMDAERASLEALLAPLAPHCAGSKERPLTEVAGTLARSHEQARRNAALRSEWESELSDRQHHLKQTVDTRNQYQRQLQDMMDRAKANTLDDLRRIHAAAEEGAELNRSTETVRAQLEELADGRSVTELLKEFAVVDAATLRVERDELEHELAGLEQKREELRQSLGALQAGLENQQNRTDAASAAVDAEAALAEIKNKADRFVQLRLAAIVLRREIERYRAANEAPLMAKANQLFPKLTLGAYQGLRVGFGEDDHPILRCVRSDGREVGVTELSDGTQDQLYLALRLASLERQATLSAPFPLILDDVLIHFDDQRARAALAVLAEFAKTSQVLFFSHQARLLELAQEAIPAGQLDFIELAPPNSALRPIMLEGRP